MVWKLMVEWQSWPVAASVGLHVVLVGSLVAGRNGPEHPEQTAVAHVTGRSAAALSIDLESFPLPGTPRQPDVKVAAPKVPELRDVPDLREVLKGAAIIPSALPLLPELAMAAIAPTLSLAAVDLPPALAPEPTFTGSTPLRIGHTLPSEEPAPPPIPIPAQREVDPILNDATSAGRPARSDSFDTAGREAPPIDPPSSPGTEGPGVAGLPRPPTAGPGIAKERWLPLDVLPVPMEAPPPEWHTVALALATETPTVPAPVPPAPPPPARAGRQAPPAEIQRSARPVIAAMRPVPPPRPDDEPRGLSGANGRPGNVGLPKSGKAKAPRRRPGQPGVDETGAGSPDQATSAGSWPSTDASGPTAYPGGSGQKTVVVDLQGDGFLQIALPGAHAGQVKAAIQQGLVRNGRVELRTATTADVARLAMNVSGTVEAAAVRRTNGGVVFGAEASVSPVSTVTGALRGNPGTGGRASTSGGGSISVDAITIVGGGGAKVVDGQAAAVVRGPRGGGVTVSGGVTVGSRQPGGGVAISGGARVGDGRPDGSIVTIGGGQPGAGGVVTIGGQPAAGAVTKIVGPVLQATGNLGGRIAGGLTGNAGREGPRR